MTAVGKILVFLFGMCICVQLVGALYGFIDLRYTFRTTYIKVLQRILIWGLVAMGVSRLLTDALQPSFIWGMIAYVFLYAGIFGTYHLLFARNAKSIKMQ